MPVTDVDGVNGGLPVQVPSDDELLREEAGYGEFRPVQVRIDHRGKTYSNRITGESSKTLVGTIVFATPARVYFEEDEKAPTCYSSDGVRGSNPAVNPSLNCAKCPLNSYSTGKDGIGKACKEVRNVLFQTEENFLPVEITFPPTSVKQFDGFTSLMRTQGKPLIKHMVKLGLESASNGKFEYARPTFEVTGVVPPDRLAVILQMRKNLADRFQNRQMDTSDFSESAEGSTIVTVTEVTDTEVTNTVPATPKAEAPKKVADELPDDLNF